MFLAGLVGNAHIDEDRRVQSELEEGVDRVLLHGLTTQLGRRGHAAAPGAVPGGLEDAELITRGHPW